MRNLCGAKVVARVLRDVGALLKRSVREVDMVIRYGGDEYTVILVETGAAGAAIVAERIRRSIEEQVFHNGVRLTASLGYACYPQDTKSKIEVGTLPETDIAQPLAELERRKGDLYASQEQMRRAELVLKLLILKDSGDPLWNQTLEPVDAPETAVVPVDLADAIRRAESSRPELSEAKTSLAERDVDVDFAKDRLKPQLDLVAGYARRGLAGSLNPNAPETGFLGGTVVVPDAMAGGFGRSFGTVSEGRFPDALRQLAGGFLVDAAHAAGAPFRDSTATAASVILRRIGPPHSRIDDLPARHRPWDARRLRERNG